MAYKVAEDRRRDLAMLCVTDSDFVSRFHHSPVLAGYRDDPRVGSTVHHVGSFLGDGGFNSYSKGQVSYLFRQNKYTGAGIPLHQMTSPAYPGSSGGGVYDIYGRYVGTLVRGNDSTMTFFVPIRYVHGFLREYELNWIRDPFSKETNKWLKALKISYKLDELS